MFCGHCGTKNPDINKFCRECGTRLPERAPRTLSEEQFADLQAPSPAPPVDHGKVAVLMEAAFSCHREGKIDEAIEKCLQATALNDQSTSAHSLLALLYEEKGQLDLAVVHLRRVLELNPDSVADQEKLARLLGEAPLQDATADEPNPPSWAADLLSRPLALSIGAGVLVMALVLAVSIPRLSSPAGRGRTEVARRPAPTTPPPAYSTGGAVRNSAPMGPSVAPPSNPQVSQPAQGAPAPAMVPPRADESAPLAQEREMRSRTAQPPAPPSPSPTPTPVLMPEDEIEPLPPPAPRRVASPPVIYLPPTRRPAMETPPAQEPPPSAVTAPPAARAQGPVEVAVTIEQGTPTPTRAEQGTPRAPSPPAPKPPARAREASQTDYQERGLAASERGDYDEALAHFRKALEGARTSRERGKIHQHMAYAYQQLGRSSDAGTEYRRAISAYEEQLREGTNTDLARSSIRSCQDGLRMLGM